MPRDINGNTSPLPGTIVNTGDTILPSQHNPMVNDVYAMMTQSLSRDGQGGMRAPLDMGTYPINNVRDATNGSDAVTLAQVQALIDSIVTIPTGIEAMWPNSVSIPAGWLRENGQAVSRTTYAALWAFAQASGNLAATEGAKTPGQFGPGNGSTTFTLPNFQADGGYFVRGITSGRSIGNVQSDEFKSHTHTATTGSAGAHTHSIPTTFSSDGTGNWLEQADKRDGGSINTNSAGAHTHSVTVNSTGGSETRPKNIARIFIIKA